MINEFYAYRRETDQNSSKIVGLECLASAWQ